MSKKTFEITFSHKFLEASNRPFLYPLFEEQLEQWRKVHNNHDYYIKRLESKEDDQGLKIIAHLVK